MTTKPVTKSDFGKICPTFVFILQFSLFLSMMNVTDGTLFPQSDYFSETDHFPETNYLHFPKNDEFPENNFFPNNLLSGN